MARQSPRRTSATSRGRTDLSEAQARQHERRCRALIAPSSDAIVFMAADGLILDASPSTRAVLGYEPGELAGRNAFDLTHPDDVAATRAQLDGLVRRDGARLLIEYRIRHKDGSWRWVESAGTNLLAAPDVGAVVIAYRDITARTEADAELRRAHDELKQRAAVLEAANQELLLLRQLGELLAICQTSDEAAHVIGRLLAPMFPGWAGGVYTASAPGGPFEIVTAWGDAPVEATVITPNDCWALRRGTAHVAYGRSSDLACGHAAGAAASACFPLSGPEGIQGILHLRAAEASAAGGADMDLAQTAAGRIALALDNIQLRAALRTQAIRDPLTGLFNRRYMEESLDRELRRAARLGVAVAVVAIDLDHFKNMNDTLGHNAGDAMLAAFGAFLKTHVRREDIACRYGGEEFVLILPGADRGAAIARTGQLLEACRHLTTAHQGITLGPVTMSMGVAVYPEHGTAGEVLLQAADRALYLAKRHGRDQMEFAAAG